MSFGEPHSFSVLSSIAEVYVDPGKLALGSFQICIDGSIYGVSDDDATLLACSFDEVKRRLTYRGMHCPSFPSDASAAEIASSFLRAIYCDDGEVFFLGIQREEFIDNLYRNFLVWAPDGDQAFDDGSVVLQFDIEGIVRLIGFKRVNDNPVTFSDLRDVHLDEGFFYRILEDWVSRFIEKRQTLLKLTD